MKDPVSIEIGKRYKFHIKDYGDEYIVGISTCGNLCYLWDDDLDTYIDHQKCSLIATVIEYEELYGYIKIFVADVKYI